MIKKRLIVFLISIIVFIGIFLAYAYVMRDQVSERYQTAQDAFNNGDYDLAIEIWTELGDYKDSIEHIEETKRMLAEKKSMEEAIAEALRLLQNGDYKEAAEIFQKLGDQDNARVALYAYAEELYQSDYDGHLSDALTVYQELGDYEDSKLKAATISVALYEENQSIIYQEAERLFDKKEYALAIEELEKIPDFEPSWTLKQKCEDALRRLVSASSISVGIWYSVAITNEGRVISTADDVEWQNKINQWEDIISVSCMDVAIIGLKGDGSIVVATSASNISEDDWQEKDFISVSSGELYIVGLQGDGKVLSQGHDAGDGQRDVGNWDNIAAIATGWRHTVGLRKVDDISEILITGYNSKSQLAQIEAQKERWEDVIAIAAGGGSNEYPGAGHTVGLKCDGTVVAVGDNTFHQCEVSTWKDVVAIAAGDWFTVGLTNQGKVYITKPDDDVIKEYNLYAGACDAESWTGIISIAAGCGNVIGVDKNGMVHAAGNNDFSHKTNAAGWKNLLVYSKGCFKATPRN